jgi:hypothetical protein
MVDGDERVFDGDPAFFAELAQGAGDGFAGGASHGGHLLMGEQEREAEDAGAGLFADLVGQLEQQAAEPGGDGFSQRDAAGILQGEAIFLADALDGAHLRFLVGAQEAEEAVTLDGAQLRGGERLGGDLVDAMSENGVEAEHGARAGDADDHLAIVDAAGGELEIASADEIEAARIFSLIEERSLGGQADGAGCKLKIGQDGAAQGAEPAGATIGAGGTSGWNLPWKLLRPYLHFCHGPRACHHRVPSDADCVLHPPACSRGSHCQEGVSAPAPAEETVALTESAGIALQMDVTGRTVVNKARDVSQLTSRSCKGAGELLRVIMGFLQCARSYTAIRGI